MDNYNINNIKLTIRADGDFLRLRTYDRTNRGSHTFIIARTKIARAMQGETVVDTDCVGFLEVYAKDDDNIIMRFSWLSVSSNNNISGYRQTVIIPADVLEHAIQADDGVTIKYLYQYRQRGKATIHADGASKTIRHIQQDKRIKRAFTKAMRDHFDWSGDDVYLFTDGFYDIYFTCTGSWSINGGLILHHYQRHGRDRVVYAVHT